MTRFSQKTLDFLDRAARQKNPNWLEKHRDQHQEVVVEPTRQFALEVAQLVRPHARNYHFPTRGFGRLRRSGDRARKYGAIFRDYVGISGSRDSGSRFEDLPGLYFHYSSGHQNIFSAGGLYTASAQQVRRIRMWIDQDPSDLQSVLKSRSFAKVFPEGLGEERKLKTKPRDYAIDHPRIELLKLTGYYVWRPIPKRDFFSARLPEIVAADWIQVLRLNAVLDQYISSVPRDPVAERFGEIRAPQVDWSAEL
jgi:uncharacterized protein (TIGR02453 family)